ncbi:ABC transporter substrate-binding protein [Brevibacillus laterosporus]|uniref:ABC transporter substrate-binding protein n=1 Tax=Brevibacillus laterosporus TaxID=1465 RepID=UPI0018CE33BB|nr:ABC transporter substrate-binding protein [Brevibacillus laterosporus]MBG9786529.1 ferrichrome ABC transporter substrate-binding protein [Brevibacillus laterosporus]MCG7318285.1 ABC transporter substrate-binding protein [Brevibacillus laterosporus]
MIRSRWNMTAWVAVLLVVMYLVAGCGKQPQEAVTQTQKSVENGQQSESQANDKETTKQSQTRVVKDEFGEVEIPVHPKRIAAIYLEDPLVALGITPIVQWYHPAWGKQDYLGLDVPTFDITGSIEALIEANPDLIIVDGGVDATKYEAYSKVAPTYRIPDSFNKNAVETFKRVADIVGMPEKAESVLKEYQKQVTDAKEKLNSSIGRETVAVIRLNVGEKPSLALFGLKNAYTRMIYEDLGLEPYEPVKKIVTHEIVSLEKIPEFNADHIIIFPSNGTWTSQENKQAVALLEDPLWKALPAVKNGHVYQMERTHWQSGSIKANTMKIEDLLKIFPIKTK